MIPKSYLSNNVETSAKSIEKVCSSFLSIDPDTNTYDYCKPYVMISEPDDNYECQADDFSTNETYNFKVNTCSKILYKEFEYESTFVTDMNLVCDGQFKVALVATLFLFGFFVGSFVFGVLGQWFFTFKKIPPSRSQPFFEHYVVHNTIGGGVLGQKVLWKFFFRNVLGIFYAY